MAISPETPDTNGATHVVPLLSSRGRHPRRPRLALAVAILLMGSTGAAAMPAAGRAQGAAASPATSAPPTTIGAIAYMVKDPDDLWQVWTICPDMTRMVQLTTGTASRNGWPTWSPDGTRIAFNTDRDTPGGSPSTDCGIWDIYAMDARDGTAKQRVTELPADASVDFAPRFSPDGNRLVFTRDYGDGGSALFVVRLDGSDLTRVAQPSSSPTEADWSPDGTQLVFDDPSKTPGVWRSVGHRTGWSTAPERDRAVDQPRPVGRPIPSRLVSGRYRHGPRAAEWLLH